MLTRRASAVAMALGVVGVLLAIAALTGSDTGLLYLAPGLLLFGLLLRDKYVGEDQICRLASALRRDRACSRRLPAASVIRCAPVRVCRGGLLIATSLAVRPPPQVAAARL